MADALTTFTDFIIKPAAPFAAGVVLFGAVWGFFKGVESVLNDDTKLEIAVWLLGVKTTGIAQRWYLTFIDVFDSLFGWKRVTPLLPGQVSPISDLPFVRSFIFALMLTMATILALVIFHVLPNEQALDQFTPLYRSTALMGLVFLLWFSPTYLSLLIGRAFLRMMGRSNHAWQRMILVALHASVSFYLGLVGLCSGLSIGAYFSGTPSYSNLMGQSSWTVWLRPHLILVTLWNRGAPIWAFVPTLFTNIWLLLYLCSGFLLKFARRFDIGFQWFNRHFDIEKKPLTCIGLVAGVLVAMVYWAVVIVSRIVG
jgi:hypothetical protein